MATKPKRPRDLNQLAKLIVDATTGEAVVSRPPTEPVRGAAGGRRGGVVRAQKLSKSRRVEIAKKAAKTRWKVAAEDN
jgi:hypothetical protein